MEKVRSEELEVKRGFCSLLFPSNVFQLLCDARFHGSVGGEVADHASGV